ncbi:MAG: DEAD/DEAH box helicase [Erysipelotrichaceae bacterium]
MIKGQMNSLILNNQNSNVFDELKTSLETCLSFKFSVAFINFGGLQLFLKTLDDLNKNNINGKIITSTYLNFTEPKALEKLSTFNNIELKVYNDVETKGFHSKAYIFEYKNEYKVIIGSSNITCSALKNNIEWNIEVISKKDDIFMVDVIDEFINLWDNLQVASPSFLEEYKKFIASIKQRNQNNKNEHFKYNKNSNQLISYDFEIIPNTMQERAINNLNKLRQFNEKKALVIAATATGKTYMSALDVKQFKPKKMLFIVHREEILRHAEKSYRRVLGNSIKTGIFMGVQKNYDAKYIFSSIQTLQRNFKMFDRNEFDYIVVDEAHHIGAETYQRVLQYFTPEFLLGMTATPERSDNFDIFNFFDNNVAIEVRLHEAMEEDLVVPFHYFGIEDISQVNYEGINTYDITAIAKQLKVIQRVDYIIKQMELYGHDGDKRKCLGFCISIDHALFMCNEFNKRGIPSACLTGENSGNERQTILNRLEDDKDNLEVIFTVDIFNEGIDIPSINLVLMLRPTQSAIIFVQQLGRGLRKCIGKQYLTVLDFIGNYNRAFLIAVALKGSRYYDKDSLKVAVDNDFYNIPGESFVQLDPISKSRILKQLELENFNSFHYLKDEYMLFKSQLNGRTPNHLMDYLYYDSSPDPNKFIKYSGTYLNFLIKVEKDERLGLLCLDESFQKALKYLSDMLPLKRPFEYAILIELIKTKEMSFIDCKNSILKYINNVDDDSVMHSIECLNFEFYDKVQKKLWTKFAHYEDDKLIINSEISNILLNDKKADYLIDTLRFGLTQYKNEFKEIDYGIPFFRLYSTYSMQEVALLSNIRKSLSSFRGSGLLTSNNDYFLFVELHKEADIKESINYKDKFFNRKFFQWQSPNATKQDSSRGKNIINNTERNINLHLFIRKFKSIDRIIQPYIYVGKMNTRGYEGNQPITIKARLEHELPIELYEELTNKVEIIH